MMDSDEIRAVVLAAIGTIAPEADLRQLAPARPLREQIELDSMDWLNLGAELQHRLSIEIPPADQQRFDTLDAIVGYLAARGAALPPPASPAPAVGLPAVLPCTRHWVAGTAVTVRPMQPGDRAAEAEFVQHLSPEARYLRFMVTMRSLSDGKLDYLTRVDQDHHVALVAAAEQGGQPALLGVARYIVDNTGTGCEFAIAVDDAWHGTGLAGILMQALVDHARRRGLATMEGLVLRTNTAMLRFARQLGFEQHRDPQDRDTVTVRRAL
ncbi:MAG TPA: GNAT family N-acetyltransferase [Ideonella sp.]|nr:GNAT family N-acetyltransferase [Ideonella sp.]